VNTQTSILLIMAVGQKSHCSWFVSHYRNAFVVWWIWFYWDTNSHCSLLQIC